MADWTKVIPGVGEHGSIGGVYWWKYYPVEMKKGNTMTFMDKVFTAITTTIIAAFFGVLLLGAAVLLMWGRG
jgi:hypothetical protein